MKIKLEVYCVIILQRASDKYNIDITITLDYEPEGFDYQMLLYDKRNRLLGVAKKNEAGGKSITIPNWCMQENSYKLKVQTRDGEAVVSEEDYNLVFRENRLQGIYQQMCQKMGFHHILQKKLYENTVSVSEREVSPVSYQRYEENYMEQMECLSQTAEFYA